MKITTQMFFEPTDDIERAKLLVYLQATAQDGHELTVTENPDGSVTASYPVIVKQGWPL